MQASDRRRTKIVATIGPSSDDPAMLTAMAAAGMDVARVPLAHGTIQDAIDRIGRIRATVPSAGIMADLPGPKMRTGPFDDNGIEVRTGSVVRFAAAEPTAASSATLITVSDAIILERLEAGDAIALGDGTVALVVQDRTSGGVDAEVISGGRLRGRPGISVPGNRVPLETPTPEDVDRLAAVVAAGVEFVAVSFVRSAEDMRAVRAAGTGDAMLIAKIETAEGVADLDAIVAASDAVMVARGDLGVRLPPEDVPHIQKRIIRTGVRFGRPVITATQMLESMITATTPTRAEVTDVASAVLDGTSAVMLSGETAIGAHPALVVETMARVARRAEREFDYEHWGDNVGAQEVSGGRASPAGITAATTGAAWRAAIEEEAAAIIACTRSGTTARSISRFRPGMPIVAATPSLRTAQQLTLSWGVDPLTVNEANSTDDIVWFAVKEAVEAGYAVPGDVVVVLAGSPTEPEPATDTMRIVRVR